VVDQDQVETGGFSDEWANGDMAKLHLLWHERCERIKAAEKREKRRQSKWAIWAIYGTLLVSAITVITSLSKWIAAFFPKVTP
jgi:hypothetical protein